MKRHVYILRTDGCVPLYFGTIKKLHKHCKEWGYPVHKNLSVFQRWFFQDGKYEIGKIGCVYAAQVV